MFDRGKIIAGILVFVVVATVPFWYGRGGTATGPNLSLDTPEIGKMAVKECVEAASYMRAGHMQLLKSWRDAVVRDGETLYSNHKGQKYSMSLSQTCLRCHSNKEKFCDACHAYAGVKPDCFSCHVAPREGGT